MNKILLVGELNPYGSDPDYALYHHPRQASGNRLRVILGLTDDQYLDEHDRVNLCDGKWSAASARRAATRVLDQRWTGTGIVLCGSKVARAFELPYPGGFIHERARRHLLVLPHPSGLNRVWSNPEAAADARARYDELRRAVGLAEVVR